MKRREGSPPEGERSWKLEKNLNPEQYVDDGGYYPDPIALRAFFAVLDPRHRPNRSAALAMWQRIVDTDLAMTPLGVDEQEFIQLVAVKIIGADKLDAQSRPDGVLAASGLYGTHREEVDTRIEEILELLDGFEVLPETTQTPSAASKKNSKRNMSLAIFASDPDIMRNLQTMEKLRKRVNKVKDKRRKK